MTDEDEMTESDPVTCPAHYAGDGTVAEIKRTVSLMRDELLQLGKSLR